MAQPRRQTAADAEINAIGTILRVLDGLDGESIRRVLEYVFSRLSISVPTHIKGVTALAPQAPPTVAAPHRPPRMSIRDLKAEKQPESSNQMAALVAYYLSDVVGEDERKESINAADLEKYFKQAGFRLPKSLPQTLPNATAAGYFDPIGNGLYKLNAVGYNLIVHGLPRSESSARQRPSKRSKKKKSRQHARRS